MVKKSDKANQQTLQLDGTDNVAIALQPLQEGLRIDDFGVTLRQAIPIGHKFAVESIARREQVRRYGQNIGYATETIQSGSHVHVHNLDTESREKDYAIGELAKPTIHVAKDERRTFEGFVRSDNRVGTRNYIGIVTTVNCSATVARHIEREFDRQQILSNFPEIDGLVSITHGGGCCIGTRDEGFETLQRTLHGYISHPNFGGVLLLGLGCETNQIAYLQKSFNFGESDRLKTMTIQGAGGTRATVLAAIKELVSLAEKVSEDTRRTVDASQLTVALQCGGSDGFSGLTANPALGLAVDKLIRHGGTAALGETPEIYGAEHLLTRRAESVEVAEKLLERVRWWENYAASRGGELNNNPTPGNKAGGLSNILEKSLGAVAKSGSTNLTDVYLYGERIQEKGFVMVDSPGYDPCSLTGQVASGCNLICFTTGRGSVYGNKPVPSIKIATNDTMYKNMSEDMDINCGGIATGETTLEERGTAIFEQILSVASGEMTKSEALGFGDCEFVPWQIGAQF